MSNIHVSLFRVTKADHLHAIAATKEMDKTPLLCVVYCKQGALDNPRLMALNIEDFLALIE